TPSGGNCNMAYPAQPNPFIRSGWVANQLLPNPAFHASALTYLGGGWNPQAALGGLAGGASPASNPQVSGTPTVNGSTLSQPPNALGGSGPASILGVQSNFNFPDWMTSLLQQMGMTGTGQGSIAPVNPAVLPKAPALEQVASKAPVADQFNTPQFGYTGPRKKKGGLFATLLDLSPGSPTLFMG